MTRLLDAGRALWLRAASPLLAQTRRHEATARALRAARLRAVPEWYLASSYAAALGAGAALAAAAWLGSAYGARLPARLAAPLALAVGVAGFALARLGFLVYPRLVAAGRARRIDAEMPGALVLAYALARGGVGVLDVLRTIAKEREAYGELAVEFGVVVRDVDWLGMDLVSALQDAAATTPSARLKAFLDGLVTLLNSGADPRDYLRSQAKGLLQQGSLALEAELEQAGMLAEIYVSGLLVLPLLLIVVLSGLSPLGGGQESLIPLIVFAFIPLGTAVYLALLETLLPPEPLAVPLAAEPPVDFGLEVAPAAAAALPAPWHMAGPGGRRLAWERARLRARDAWRRWITRILAKPVDAVELSGTVGLVLALLAGGYLFLAGVGGSDLLVAATGVAVIVALVVAIPISVFHEMRVHRARVVDDALPETLSKLAGFNERGIGLLQSFHILGRSATGPLAGELRAAEQDVAWNGSLANALRRLRARLNTNRVAKVGILLERASFATGRLKEVLDIAAEDATLTGALRKRKRLSMVSYVVVVYIVFAVFLYVLYTVASLFYGPQGFGGLSAGAGGGLSPGLDPGAARLMLMQAGIVQGVCCGLVAGRLGEGHLLSGLKHAALLGTFTWLLFLWGVL